MDREIANDFLDYVEDYSKLNLSLCMVLPFIAMVVILIKSVDGIII